MYGHNAYAEAPYAEEAGILGAIGAVTFPMMTAEGAATVLVTATGAATLPMMLAAGSGAVLAQASGAATLPMLTAAVSAAVLVQATGLGSFPMLTVVARMVTGTRRRLYEWASCAPTPTSSFTPRGRVGTLRQGPQG